MDIVVEDFLSLYRMNTNALVHCTKHHMANSHPCTHLEHLSYEANVTHFLNPRYPEHFCSRCLPCVTT